MELYTKSAYKLSRDLTRAYSTSFSASIRLFSPDLRYHISAIYGLVRIADEIVDTYTGVDKRQLLDDLERETKAAIKRGYSTNPIVHSFAVTAKQYKITNDLIVAFFKSMRLDLSPKYFTQALYETYIYGSAEVIGLMSLKVFTNDEALYKKLEKGAARLGAGYQKVNFLRDINDDANVLGRWYFPNSSYETFTDKTKQSIIKDIEKDFAAGERSALKLPESSRKAVLLSIAYYRALLVKIANTPAETLKLQRIRINNAHKSTLFLKTLVKRNTNDS